MTDEEKPEVKPSLTSKPPLKFPPIGIGDHTYHPTFTPRKNIKPLAPRQALSGNGHPLDSSLDFGPDINSIGTRGGESIISDSGFSSQYLYPPYSVPIIKDHIDDVADVADEYDIDPLPFQSQNFKSSTVMRMVTVPRRHQDMFNCKDKYYAQKKGVAFHTGRYGYLEAVTNNLDRSPSQLSQRERLLTETAHLEKIRDIRRQLDSSAPHRLALNLQMGGSKMEFTDRVDIPAELRELRGIVLPTHAMDLYVGRGIKLPEGHRLNKPRRFQLKPLI